MSTHPCWEGGVACWASFHLPLLACFGRRVRLLGKFPLALTGVFWEEGAFVGQVATCPYWCVLGGGCVCWASFHLLVGQVATCPYWRVLGGGWGCRASLHLLVGQVSTCPYWRCFGRRAGVLYCSDWQESLCLDVLSLFSFWRCMWSVQDLNFCLEDSHGFAKRKSTEYRRLS